MCIIAAWSAKVLRERHLLLIEYVLPHYNLDCLLVEETVAVAASYSHVVLLCRFTEVPYHIYWKTIDVVFREWPALCQVRDNARAQRHQRRSRSKLVDSSAAPPFGSQRIWPARQGSYGQIEDLVGEILELVVAHVQFYQIGQFAYSRGQIAQFVTPETQNCDAVDVKQRERQAPQLVPAKEHLDLVDWTNVALVKNYVVQFSDLRGNLGDPAVAELHLQDAVIDVLGRVLHDVVDEFLWSQFIVAETAMSHRLGATVLRKCSLSPGYAVR